jgi:hypothetical protein
MDTISIDTVVIFVFVACRSFPPRPDLNYVFVVVYRRHLRASFRYRIFRRRFSSDFWTTMAIDSDLNKVLSGIGLQDASKEAIAKELPTIEDLEDLFYEMADNRAKVESTLHLVVDMAIVSDTDIRRTMFVFDWFIDNIVDPNFALVSFTRGAHISDKSLQAITKVTKTTAAASSTSTTPVTSTIDFSTDVLTADSKRQTTPVTPGTMATPKPHLLWKSPFASATSNSSNIHQLHNTETVLASSSPIDVLEFYRKLVAAAKPAEIDLSPIGAFDPGQALWPHNH